MAIKKHLFNQYIKEQESFNLLRKSPHIHQKYSHNKVFDEPPSLKPNSESNIPPVNGSQKVHENLAAASHAILDACESGSQTVHASATQENHAPHSTDTNGSQTVDKTAAKELQNPMAAHDNGSQMVHTTLLPSCLPPAQSPVNGSQTVDKIIAAEAKKLEDAENNGSQTVHDLNKKNLNKKTLRNNLNDASPQRQEQPSSLSDEDVNLRGRGKANEVEAHLIETGQENNLAESGVDINGTSESSSTVHQTAAANVTSTNNTLIQQGIGSPQPLFLSDANPNGSQTVHGLTKNHISQENGSQAEYKTVHKNTDTPTAHITYLPDNGSRNAPQMVHKTEINGSLYLSQMVHENQTVHKRVTEPITNGSQMVHDFSDFSSLPTTQRNILRALWLSAHINGNRTTSRLTLPYIAESSKVNKNSLKNSIWRLKQKGFLKVKAIKDGRGGWVIYEIPKDIFLEIFTFENGSQTVHKRSTEPITNPLYSSSYINTTTTVSANESLSQEWQSIDTDPLKHIGLNSKHILELANIPNVNPSVVQESIYHYAWGETNNPATYKAHRNPLAILLGVLKKGKAWVESNYKPSHQVALENLLEQRRCQYQAQEGLIEQIVNLEFPSWKESLSDNEISKFAAEVPSWDKLATDRALKTHFKKEKIIPRLKREGKFKSFEENLDKLNA